MKRNVDVWSPLRGGSRTDEDQHTQTTNRSGFMNKGRATTVGFRLMIIQKHIKEKEYE